MQPSRSYFNTLFPFFGFLISAFLSVGFAYKNVDEGFFRKPPSARCTVDVCTEAPVMPTITTIVQDTQLHTFKKTIPDKIKLNAPKPLMVADILPDSLGFTIDTHTEMVEKSEWWVKRLLYDVKDIASSLSPANFISEEDELFDETEEENDLLTETPTPTYKPDKRIVDGFLYINGVLASEEEHLVIGLKTPAQVEAETLITAQIEAAIQTTDKEVSYRATASRYPAKTKNIKKEITTEEAGLIEVGMPLMADIPADVVVPPIYRTGGSPVAGSVSSVLLANVYAEDIPADGHYDNNWNTSNIHPYRYNVTEMPGRVEFFLSHGLGDDFTLPVGGIVTSGFGPRWGRYHNGVDLDLNTGDHVKAAFEGMVRIAQYSSSYGYVVVIRHYSGLETTYAHLSKIYVAPNQKVKAGDLIALGGSTGRSTGAHLHFEVRYKGFPIDPTIMIDFANGKLKTHTLKVDKYFFSSSSSPYLDAHDNSYRSNGRSHNHSHKHTSASSSGSKKYHTVKKGDTLHDISRRYGKSVKELCQLNRLSSASKLSIGQKIRVK
ncbi:MAG TPA: M23 family metallopeptidase [Chitinophagales bacterium]|nr:M23 family metallopeptidase [Chitinophagales bacterium]HRK27902.1 M23 family metallopeptidase [Chitinophagales bacterium]